MNEACKICDKKLIEKKRKKKIGEIMEWATEKKTLNKKTEWKKETVKKRERMNRTNMKEMAEKNRQYAKKKIKMNIKYRSRKKWK